MDLRLAAVATCCMALAAAAATIAPATRSTTTNALPPEAVDDEPAATFICGNPELTDDSFLEWTAREYEGWRTMPEDQFEAVVKKMQSRFMADEDRAHYAELMRAARRHPRTTTTSAATSPAAAG